MASFDEPLSAYQHELRGRHAQAVREHLEQLIAKANVDAHENQATVKAIGQAHEQIQRVQRWLNGWRGLNSFLTLLCWLCGALFVGVIVLLLAEALVADVTGVLVFSGCLAGVILLVKYCWLKRKIQRVDQQLADLKAQHHALLKTAWEQMRPLNQLFTWDTVTDLLRKTLPEIHFDHSFSHQQFEDLVAEHSWRHVITDAVSVVDLQSGHLHGNPFALVKGQTMRMGEKTYSGTKVVAVRKTRRGANGRRESYISFETLYAEVTRPCPEYYNTAFLLFGSEAAPNLSFSRAPSKHSGKADTFFNRLAKNRTTKKLEAFSRNLDDEYGFTMMANREFETLFHATDRSDEREFRLLFTPYAQQQMVKLLNDTTVGYGDHFHLIKEATNTLLLSDQLTEANLSLNPTGFWHYDIVEVKRRFITFNADYFKAFYFSLAPFMTIPLYCQPSQRAARANSMPKFETSTWESEVIANAYGEEHFRHPESATPSLLKTKTTRNGDATVFHVIAKSFAAHKRVEYVSKWDSNGNCHRVPVEWIEYLPLKQARQVIALPDHTLRSGGPTSKSDAIALLRENGFPVRHCLHIRSTYVALL